jgi:galactokinase
MRERLLDAMPDARVIASAPGRVNLIGEHTDYNGFPVLPMAIDRRVWIAARTIDEPILRVRSLDPESYAEETVALDQLESRPRAGTWVDYVIAAARRRSPAVGTELLVGGDVPPEAGLSSSSGLVVASFLALAEPGDRAELAEEARRAERYVGTLSGGMDQAISLLGLPGHALRIDFRPLRVQPVPVPAELAVVVAHSGVRARKSGAARAGYNARVQECARAAVELGAPVDGLLADVPGEVRAARAAALQDALLARRARFVFEEARRVEAAFVALASRDFVRLGELLDASHAGLRDDYEVSHPKVDELVERARAAGALGARIVGAGFGGCIVALCRESAVDALLSSLGPEAWRFEAAGPATRERL